MEDTEENLITEVVLHGEATLREEEAVTEEAITQVTEAAEVDITRELKVPQLKMDRRLQVDSSTKAQETLIVEASEDQEVAIAEVVVAISRTRITQGLLQVALKISRLSFLNTEEEVATEVASVEDTEAVLRVEKASILETREINIMKENFSVSSQKEQQLKAMRRDSRKSESKLHTEAEEVPMSSQHTQEETDTLLASISRMKTTKICQTMASRS